MELLNDETPVLQRALRGAGFDFGDLIPARHGLEESHKHSSTARESGLALEVLGAMVTVRHAKRCTVDAKPGYEG